MIVVDTWWLLLKLIYYIQNFTVIIVINFLQRNNTPAVVLYGTTSRINLDRNKT